MGKRCIHFDRWRGGVSIWFSFKDRRKMRFSKATLSGELTMIFVSWFVCWIILAFIESSLSIKPVDPLSAGDPL